MRRADRLFQLVQFLRKRRRAVTAQVIAEHFGICKRTVYRDVADLVDSGVPVMGEAGVGYLLDRNYQLPALMFELDELAAITLGLQMVRDWTDAPFAERARAAQARIESALPAPLLERLDRPVLHSLPSRTRPPQTVGFSDLHRATLARRRIRFDYVDEKGRASERTARPLALVFFGPVWLLVAWCERRRDFRNFRLDRMDRLAVLDEVFPVEADKSLERYIELHGG